MLLKNILPGNKKVAFVALIICFMIIINALTMCFRNSIYAAQTKESYSTKINNYPGYSQIIQDLKTKRPNWNFTLLYTGLDWNEVIKNETVAYHGRSLVSSNKSSYWFCATCGTKNYDNGTWKCASEAAVSYYMDPRNWINEDNIFQFEDLSYNGNIQTINGVSQILNGTWMSGNSISYIDTSGNTQTINKSYAQVIMESAATSGISPYHLAARIRQEQGTSRASSTGSGTYTGFLGYYNLLNIKASGNGTETIIRNALTHAQTKGWTDPEKSILGGAQFISAEYINRGQSTLYLQKFDVDSSDGSLYYHQYMQNIEAAKTEGGSVKNSYSNMGLLDKSINFLIPVYENMPTEISAIPGSKSIVTQNVIVNGIDVAIRDGAGINSNIITRLNTGENLLRIELASSSIDGHLWDKIVLPNGTKGFISRIFINQVSDITNVNESAVTNTGVNLRNGPGTSGTSVIIMLSKGQAVTVMENGKYNGIDGYNWSRVRLANGTQGYLVSDYISNVQNGTSTPGYSLAVLNGNGVRLRTQVGTTYPIVTTLNTGDVVTITQKNAGTANGFNWDKVVTSSGLEGYIANVYLTPQSTTPPTQPSQPPITTPEPPIQPVNPVVPTTPEPLLVVNSNFKIENSNIICLPETTVGKIKSNNPSAMITKNSTSLGDTEMVATGDVIKIGNTTHTIIKKGDTNGDGVVNTIDALRVLKHDVGKISITGDLLKSCDINSDGSVNTIDALRLLKFDVGLIKIQL
ncbi:MAG TPA: SH3 domain-containing protein [Clostridia bacterium]|nr:SH3 domain-containing protein [Clostridia bacterium]